jgi:hypothetical protein
MFLPPLLPSTFSVGTEPALRWASVRECHQRLLAASLSSEEQDEDREDEQGEDADPDSGERGQPPSAPGVAQKGGRSECKAEDGARSTSGPDRRGSQRARAFGNVTRCAPARTALRREVGC